jgi:glycogen debranching enzyme
MEDVIQVQDQFYILATASKAGEQRLVLQQGDTFALFDLYGDMGALGSSDQGVYHEGTRYLSRFRLRLNDKRLLLLSARVKEDNELFGADLTNPDIPLSDPDQVLARDLVHLFRGRFIWEGSSHERIRLWNYGQSPVHIVLTFDYEADFADIFEVRGMRRERRGTILPADVGDRSVRLGYRGLDGEDRWTVLDWSDRPAAISPTSTRFEFDLPPQQPTCVSLSIRCERAGRRVAPRAYDLALADAMAALEAARSHYARVESSSERFNQWMRRSAADVRMLVADTPYGEYPYAGVPWFSTPFGRDGIITALQLLWINPQLARGVLGYLAATQADSFKAEEDAEPGKILHETRSSEMARVGEVPFGRYYGSVDATPLFVALAGAYYQRTADVAFVRTIFPHVERALEWIDRYGDADGDGFVEYSRRSSSGLVQQGWKDSQDSVFHADGTLAEPPIALCEVQGYVFEAKQQAAVLAAALGDTPRANRLRSEAEKLRQAFEAQFWCEDLSCYAIALDGRKQPCRVRTSNAGQVLFSAIAQRDRARRVAELLTSPQMFSGWGIRTVASTEARYNPMSYHNGSVWPHDNGMIVAGFSRYGFDDLTSVPLTGLFDASVWLESRRLPELFCGFHRRSGEGPTLYPVACSPQAWAAGVVFQLLQSCLRLRFDPSTHELLVERPMLPPFLKDLTVSGLAVPGGTVDLEFEQGTTGARVSVTTKQGDVGVRVGTSQVPVS